MNDKLQDYAEPDCEFCGGKGVVQHDDSEDFNGFHPTYGPCICIDDDKYDEYEDDEAYDNDDDDLIFSDGDNIFTEKLEDFNDNLNLPNPNE